MTRIFLAMVLNSLQWLLIRASKNNPDFRAGLGKDTTISLETKDCASAYFSVVNREFIAAKCPENVQLQLSFNTAGTALKFLLSRDPLVQLIDGISKDNISMHGNIMLLLWFQGRIRQAMPFSNLRNNTTKLSGATTGPLQHSKISRGIVRLGVEDEIEHSWHQAIAAREEIIMWKVRNGKTAPPY